MVQLRNVQLSPRRRSRGRLLFLAFRIPGELLTIEPYALQRWQATGQTNACFQQMVENLATLLLRIPRLLALYSSTRHWAAVLCLCLERL